MSEKQTGETDENDACEEIDKEEVTEDLAGQGTIPCNVRINVEEASEAEVMMLTENLLTFEKDNFSAAKVTEDSLSLDVMSLPKFERKVRKQSCITEAEVNQKSSGKWMEECILASENHHTGLRWD
ncbi:hypothetical protein AWC38_SpisGene21765 [Stylophora pistillata]|uniref:Uncharacterized protein n=1 Tax=Stylophora pistillata TaxID=50429 RepID=A0A2B4RCS7_STYPI|nr:hypothetical protein AWC38_SpisGene21765 [Stylophora pistillata]